MTLNENQNNTFCKLFSSCLSPELNTNYSRLSHQNQLAHSSSCMPKNDNLTTQQRLLKRETSLTDSFKTRQNHKISLSNTRKQSERFDSSGFRQFRKQFDKISTDKTKLQTSSSATHQQQKYFVTEKRVKKINILQIKKSQQNTREPSQAESFQPCFNRQKDMQRFIQQYQQPRNEYYQSYVQDVPFRHIDVNKNISNFNQPKKKLVIGAQIKTTRSIFPEQRSS